MKLEQVKSLSTTPTVAGCEWSATEKAVSYDRGTYTNGQHVAEAFAAAEASRKVASRVDASIAQAR